MIYCICVCVCVCVCVYILCVCVCVCVCVLDLPLSPYSSFWNDISSWLDFSFFISQHFLWASADSKIYYYITL